MNTVNLVINALEDNGYSKEASDLKKLLEEIESEDSKIKTNAINKVEGLCSIRSFGNLHISTMNGWAWNSLLGKLKRNVQRKIP